MGGDPVFADITAFNDTLFEGDITHVCEDVLDDKVYDIQESKLRTEQDKKELEAATK